MITLENKQEIREAVKEVVKELKRSHMLKNEADAIYSDTSSRLFRYYEGGEHNEAIKAAISEFENDQYKDIIPLYFKDKWTIEAVAEIMGVDVSTIVRNKKRICMGIYLLLE